MDRIKEGAVSMRLYSKFYFCIFLMALSAPVMAVQTRVVDNSPEAIEQRLQPPGLPQLHVKEVAAAAETAGSGLGLPGDQIYNQFCSVCHAAGVAGAPKLGDKVAWKPRIDQGIETLLQHAIQGINAMPPKGTCAQCSDSDLKATIEYMISK